MSVCKIEERTDKCNLVIVTSNPLPIGDEVVRWCSHCGAVVVDVDCDGRTQPGYIKEMQFPALAKLNNDGKGRG